MKRLLGIALRNRKYRVLLAITVVSMILLTFASQLEMFAVGIITNINHSKQDNLIQRVIDFMDGFFSVSNDLTHLAFFLVFVAIFKATSMFIQRFTVKLAAIYLSKDLRQKYFEHIQSLPMNFYQQYNIGSLSSRVVGDSAQISEAISSCLTNYLQTPFTMVTTLTLCFFTSWKLTLMIFLGFPLIVYPISFLAKRVKRISRQIQQNQERFAAVLIDFLAGIQTVKVFAMESFSLKKYQEQNEHMAALERRSARYDLSTRPIVHTIAMAFLASTLLYGLHFLEMSISEVIFYCGLLYIFYEPVKKFAEENSHIQRGIVAADRMFEVMNLKSQIIDQDGASHLDNFEESIEFDNVWFRYQEQWVLKGVSFSIKKGETVAIVGPTGAGKSTIVQLLPRLYDIQEGDIRIDGKSINTYTQKSLREAIAFVPQRPFLFLDTVNANISYGRNFSQDQILAAAKKAHADEFICQLPQGYHSEIAEMGKNLSGGQQQRLAIARALVKNAPLLVMDEATSSLDNISENHIKSAIRQLKGQVTQIIIAHRLSTIEDADRIIYLERGVKIAEGTKTELLNTCQGFRHMWEVMHHSRDSIQEVVGEIGRS